MWIPRTDALGTLAKAEKVDLLQEKLVAKQRDIDTLIEKIRVKEQIISEMIVKDKADSAIIETYKVEISVMEGQKSIYERIISDLKKQIRKERRKRRWTAIVGVAATVGAFWLGTKF